MAVKAILEIEGKKFNILEFNYKLEQPANKIGYPSGNVSGGHIRLVLESDKDIFAFEWTKSHDLQKEGTITFYNQDGISIFKKLKFQEAYCLLYKEEFNSDGKIAMHILLKYHLEIAIIKARILQKTGANLKLI